MWLYCCGLIKVVILIINILCSSLQNNLPFVISNIMISHFYTDMLAAMKWPLTFVSDWMGPSQEAMGEHGRRRGRSRQRPTPSPALRQGDVRTGSPHSSCSIATSISSSSIRGGCCTPSRGEPCPCPHCGSWVNRRWGSTTNGCQQVLQKIWWENLKVCAEELLWCRKEWYIILF